MMSIARQEALNLLAIRRAAAVAIASVESSLRDAQPISEHVRLHKEKIELEVMLLATQNALLDKLTMEITQGEKVSFVFYLTDSDAGGSIDAHKLAEVLCRLNSKLGSNALSVAKKTIAVFAGRNKTFLDQDHFEVFLQHLANTMHCSFHNLCLLMVVRLAFNETGEVILAGAAKLSSDKLDDALFKEARLTFAYEIIDFQKEGTVSSEDVLRYTSRITKDPTRAKRFMLRFAHKADNYGTIDYPGFCGFVQKISAAYSTDFNDVINSITLAVGRQVVSGSSVREMLLDSDAYENALRGRVLLLSDDDEILDYGKMNRLYDLLDVDHDGSLDIAELALFFRRFQEEKSIDKTISESIHAMFAADINGDNRLDKKEFAQLVAKLSSSCGVEMHRLVDLFIVETALKDVDKKEKEYIAQLKASGSTSKKDYCVKKDTRHIQPLKLGRMLLAGLRHERNTRVADSA